MWVPECVPRDSEWTLTPSLSRVKAGQQLYRGSPGYMLAAESRVWDKSTKRSMRINGVEVDTVQLVSGLWAEAPHTLLAPGALYKRL